MFPELFGQIFGTTPDIPVQFGPESFAVVLDSCVKQLVQDYIIAQFRRKPGQVYVQTYVVLAGATAPPGPLVPYRDVPVFEIVQSCQLLQSFGEGGTGFDRVDSRKANFFVLFRKTVEL